MGYFPCTVQTLACYSDAALQIGEENSKHSRAPGLFQRRLPLCSSWIMAWAQGFGVFTQHPSKLLEITPLCERVAPSLFLLHVVQMELNSLAALGS